MRVGAIFQVWRERRRPLVIAGLLVAAVAAACLLAMAPWA
jgi:hypothetical protein